MRLTDSVEGYDVDQARGVGPLLDEWAALADRAGAPPSLHPGYVTAWVDAYSNPQRLRAVTARRDGELAAVLPLVMTRWGLSTAAQPDVEEVGVVSDDPRAASAAMTAALKLPVARLLLRPVPAGSVTHVALAQAAAARGATLIERVVDEHPRVDVDSDWDTYWASFKSRVRNDVSRRRRRLEELGRVDIEVLDGAVDLDGAIDTILAIEASGWKGRAGTAVAFKPADEAFYRALARWAAARGWLRLSFLRLDGRAIAFHYSLQARGVIYALKIGYSEQFAAQAPGKILLVAEIERAFREGCRCFDFAGSAADYKTLWATSSRELLELSAFPATALGRTGRLGGDLRARAIPVAKRARRRLRSISREVRRRSRSRQP